jgi:uncharacterized OB-fold protein
VSDPGSEPTGIGDVLAPQPEGIPLPTPSQVSLPYWDAARDEKLVYQRCSTCLAVPPRPVAMCGICGGRHLPWETSSGRGTLYSWTVVWRPQHPSFRVPYAPAVMAVEEGWWLMTSVIGCGPEDLREAMPLEVVFYPAGGNIWLPYAQPSTPGVPRV